MALASTRRCDGNRYRVNHRWCTGQFGRPDLASSGHRLPGFPPFWVSLACFQHGGCSDSSWRGGAFISISRQSVNAASSFSFMRLPNQWLAVCRKCLRIDFLPQLPFWQRIAVDNKVSATKCKHPLLRWNVPKMTCRQIRRKFLECITVALMDRHDVTRKTWAAADPASLFRFLSLTGCNITDKKE